MRFAFEEDGALPTGAWCLRARAGRDVVEVRHGASVETLDSAFVFGAFPGSFTSERYANAPVRMGTGAAIDGGRLVLLPPSHPYEHIAITRRRDELLASNSLVFLLAVTNSSPRIGEARYYFRFNAAHATPSKYFDVRFDAATLSFLLCDRFALGPDLSLLRLSETQPISLPDFAAYRCHLSTVLAELAENARSSDRRRPLSLSATISAGYDSAASAALARDAGWRDAVTFVRGDDDPDDGSIIGAHLGYRVERCHSSAWRTSGANPEAEFLAASGPTPRLQLAGATDALGGALVLNGNCGDVVWENPESQLRPGLTRVGAYVPSSTSTTEWGLRVGAIQLPVPAIGAAESAQIATLASSPEMQPWTLGNEYDRPIPRRVLEECGVPRDAFGVAKRGGCYVETPSGMTDESRADLEAWLADHTPSLSLARRNTSWYASRAFVRGLSAVAPHTRRAQRLRERQHLSQPSWAKGHLFHWGVEKTRVRYGSVAFD